MIIQNINSAIPSDVNAGNVGPNIVLGTPTPAPTSPPPSTQQIKLAVDSINQVMQQTNHSLEFSMDSDTKVAVVKVIDTETGQLIVQIPSKVALAIAESIDQQQQGLLLSHKA